MRAGLFEHPQGLAGLLEDLEQQSAVGQQGLRCQGVIGPRRDGFPVALRRLRVLLALLAIGRQGQLVA